MKLRILHLAQFLGVGGLEKVLFLLINEQLRAGHQVELMVYDYEQAWVPYFRKHGIKVDTSFKKGEGYDLKLLKYVSEKCKHFDVIHTHDLNPLMYAAPVKLLHSLTGRRLPKLIHTAHGMDHLHKRPVTKLYEKLCSFQTNYTVGVSTAVCEYYLKLGVPGKKVVNINNGTLLTQISEKDRQDARTKLRQDLGLRDESIIWVTVARVVPLKDQMLICEAARSFPDLTFLLIGPSGDDKYWNMIQATKPKNVLTPGARADITDILLGSDFFISASTHEGIPVSVLEAGATSLPCLLSDIPGHQVIQHGSVEPIATFFTTGDLKDLAMKVDQLRNNLELKSKVSAALHKHVKENFSSHTMYKQYLEVYAGKQCSRS